jgi:putative lipoprotein (rSAM/lipoprotein system)
MSAKSIYRKTLVPILRLLSVSIGAILGVFCNLGSTAPKYGMPNADYKVSGTVSAADQNMPVKGLLVSIADTLNPPRIIDSAKTDSLGNYSLEFSGAPWENTWNLKTRDIDSVENGSFTEKDTVISIPESDLKEPNGNWYLGHGEKVVDVKVGRNKE